MISVTLDKVAKKFDQVVGVENVDIQIQPGEFFTFLGPSGCGKTTTLRMIAGFYYPSSGRIRFGEQDVTYLPPNKRNTGMVFQNYALFPHLTVFENVAFGLKVRKLSKGEIQTRVERALEQVHLPGMGSRRIDQLSGGQQQRVALARALVIEPGILLLDEPLSNLDAKLREETRSEIKRLQLDLGITTIYVTHDQAEAMAMSDRIMVMEKGQVQQIGTPKEIYNRPANRFVASFIGETNLLEGTVEQVTGEEVTVQIAPSIRLTGLSRNANSNVNLNPGSKVVLSIRPEVLQAATGWTENVLNGDVVLSEFTGVSVNYLAQVQEHTLRAMFVNTGMDVRERGESIALHVPKDRIYFVE
ncbi:ABC transporter ATP-binding protein [Effusibacillus lacus]|uniref:Spermidine/putrescine ABC transporter ATP-binding protein n=1 Tax=Effusibacillus lacus TaxID=1348429 RepID=A0A292YP92_9BACL|nr:ABC transporter ATP-binding protein [Effusibacillus lacus]TCS71088.1 iron(III) transport system ATP-binding protein [Effusibacillus lacus]GAX90731.1 spermidine/putrescine ABC transporter ATP-binding protein [Effusibacillus lacus]